MMTYGLPNEDGSHSKMRFEEFQVMEKAIRDEGIIDSQTNLIVIEDLAKLFLNQ